MSYEMYVEDLYTEHTELSLQTLKNMDYKCYMWHTIKGMHQVNQSWLRNIAQLLHFDSFFNKQEDEH